MEKTDRSTTKGESVKWVSDDNRAKDAANRSLDRLFSYKGPTHLIAGEDGSNVSFNGEIFDDTKFIISSFLEIPSISSDMHKQSIVGNALFTMAKQNDRTVDKLYEIIFNEVNSYKQHPSEVFNVVIPTNIRNPRFNMETEGANLINAKFSVGRNILVFRKWQYILQKFDCVKWKELCHVFQPKKEFVFDESSICVVCTLSARNSDDASHSAFQSWAQLRALMNFTLLYGNSNFSFGGIVKPLAAVMPSPISATFQDGISPKLYGPQEDSIDEWNVIPLRKSVVHNIRWWMKHLNQNQDHVSSEGSKNLRSVAFDAITNYGTALESLNRRNCFLGLWNILELMTYQSSVSRYSIEDVRKRASILLAHDDYLVDHLYIAYRLRNSYVHSGVFPDDIQMTVDRLKLIVEVCIGRFFNLTKTISSWQEVEAYYTHAPLNNKALNDRKRIIAYLQASRAKPSGHKKI